METSTVLVAGATGLVGSEICRLLSARNLTVKAIFEWIDVSISILTALNFSKKYQRKHPKIL